MPAYDVAISYASEDTNLADIIANRLRQDGYRCFYNPNRLHKLLGLNIADALQDIYGQSNTIVVALISPEYLRKAYPMQELAAATQDGPHRIIPIRVGAASLPSSLDGVSYASLSSHTPEVVAKHVSEALGERIRRPEVLQDTHEVRRFSIDTVAPLDNPRRPYALSDVEFFDAGDQYFVDIASDTCEFSEPHHYVNRGAGTLSASNPFASVTLDMVMSAKARVRELLAKRTAAGWEVFNGRKFGVARIRRTRQAESEHHRLIVNVYETDYYTSLFSKALYSLLSPAKRIRIDRGGDLSEYSGLLTSFGFDILLFAPQDERPHLVLTQRSMNVANAESSGGLWHVSMNEGLSASDRFGTEFDAASTFFRGFAEELNLDRRHISRSELFEPFLEYNNFELGIAGAAYTPLDAAAILEQAAMASDSILETHTLRTIPATTPAIRSLIERERGNMTNLLLFCLESVLIRDLCASQ